MNKIEFIKEGETKYLVCFNKKVLGYLYIEVDGFYVFIENEFNGGCWAAWTLRAIADKLDELNEPYNEMIEREFKKSVNFKPFETFGIKGLDNDQIQEFDNQQIE